MAIVNGTSGNDFIHVSGDGFVAPAGYNNLPDATDGNDTIYSGNGGDDIIHAGGGDDQINFTDDLTNADRIDGGAGYDTLIIRDPTSVYFGANSLTGIEDIFLPFIAPHASLANYVLALTSDANIAAGSEFTVYAAGLDANTFFHLDYSQETDASTISVTGGAGHDSIKGRVDPTLPQGAASDQIDFSQGGADFFLGDGDVYFGGALSADDSIIGQTRVRVAGDYSAGLTLTGVMLGGSGGYFVIGDGGPGFGPQGVGADNDYKFTATDDLIPAGGSWVFQVGFVGPGHSVYVDDSAETDALDVSWSGSASDDTFIGGSANDSFYMGDRNGGGTDAVYGGAGDDTILGGSTITAADHIDGGPGEDTLALDGDYSGGLTIDGVQIANIETIGLGTDRHGSGLGSFKITTTDAAVPAGGTMTIDAGLIESGTGALNFDGSAETNGSFVIVASPGNDTLTGGAGNDTVSYAKTFSTGGGVTVGLSNPNPQNTGPSGTDTLRSIENVTGSHYADHLTGNAGANVLDGGLGDDILAGGDGNDTYFLRDVNRYTPVTQAQALDAGAFAPIGIVGFYRYDTVIENPNAGIDTVKVAPVPGGTQYTLPANVENGQVIDTGAFALIGNGLDNFLLANDSGDRLDGGAGNDTLQGGTGADTLIGGTGNDVLVGGAGDDRFVFGPGDGMDSVIDFTAGHGADDKVDLTAYSNIRSFESVLDHATQYSSDTMLKLDNSDALTLRNVAVSQLDPDDFVLLKNPPHDFNADGNSDLLWQNDNGAVSIWEMDGTSVVSNPTLKVNPGPAWHVIGSGDFNDDGIADILWQNTSGAVSIWEMDGASVVSNPTLSVNPGPSWHVIGTGDFNADGKADILWQNTNGAVSIWEMDGTSVISNPTLATNPGPSWHVIGTGDFNNDGRSDLLWQNDSGAVSIWEMSGTSVASNPTLGTNPGPAWHVKDAGDFNDDGFSDLLWQNDSGAVSIWEMDGTDILSNPTLGTNPGPSWQVVNAADYNGDGHADIAWQNDNGAASIWEMNGTNVLSNPTLSPNPGSSWHVIGPNHGLVT